ncbi:MAG: methyltransferase domain-containing protein [Myxococcota bacterium]|nr:methyltransferase domain-containing protein [Myxococcota bacterium]
MAADTGFPAGFFDRQDESDDALFYSMPRFVVHIDEATIAALTDAYRELLPPGSDVLDLMSSWVSHLPEDLAFARVAGLGMNGAELEANPRLTEHVVHDLNRDPELPYESESFDAVVNAVSIQYLTRPVEVFRSVARVLRPGGVHLVAMSHRCFPTKAIRAWHVLPPRERLAVTATYFRLAEGYDEARFLDRSPEGADPLWIVLASARADPPAADGA